MIDFEFYRNIDYPVLVFVFANLSLIYRSSSNWDSKLSIYKELGMY